LRRHALLFDAVAKLGFDVRPFDVSERDAGARLRYLWTAGAYAARAALLPGPGGRRERTSASELKAAFDRSPQAFALKSREFAEALGRSPVRPQAIVHVFGLSSPQPVGGSIPFAHYLDYTYSLALRGSDSPVRPRSDGERSRFLELERRSYERATAIFTMSRLVRDSLIDDYGIAPGKIVVAGAGPNMAAASDAPKTYGSRRLLFNASEFVRKGGDLVFAAFDRLHATDPRATLITVGAPVPAAYAGRPGVHERGRVTLDEMRDLYAASDVVLAPSLRDPFPGVVIEAMANGTPAIVRDRDGMPEIVTDEIDGLVLRDADATPDQLASLARGLLDDDARLRRLSHAARATVAARLNWGAVAQHMLPFLSSASELSP
jgi:glycosyltransferase involved in cell wall biosynthesis